MSIKKYYLIAPGPTPVPESALSKAAEPIIHHRTPKFSAIFRKVSEELKYVFQTQNDVYIFTSSGTGAMEAAVVNVMKKGKKAIVVRGGKFGERWGEICEAYGIDYVPVDIEWGDVVEVEHIKKAIEENPDTIAVYTTLSETSTGVVYDIKALGEFLKDKPQILVVDAISGLGAVEFYQDDWHVDIVVAGSQKGLMIPPGLAFLSASEKAWKYIEESDLPKYYWDLKAMKKNLAKDTTPFTPGISLIMQLNEALEIIKKEGLDNIIARHKKLGEATRAGVVAMGLELFPKRGAGNVCTAVKVPEGIDGVKLLKLLREEYGVTLAGGQAHLKGKIVRIAHLGYMTEFDVIIALTALEAGLQKMGYKVEAGKGVAAAEKILFDL